MSDGFLSRGSGSIEDEVAYMVGNLLSKHEGRVDSFLHKLKIGPNSGKRGLKRLDRAFLLVVSSVGVAKGLSTTARKNLKIPTRAINRAASVSLLSLTALFILAHARVRGLSTDDPRVQQAVRNALIASAALPVGHLILDNLSRFARPSVGLPQDPRTWLVLAAGAAGGVVTGKALGDAIVSGVYDALGDPAEPLNLDTEFDEDEAGPVIIDM